MSLCYDDAGVSEEDSKKLEELAENLDLSMVDTSDCESESTSNASSSSESFIELLHEIASLKALHQVQVPRNKFMC